jgi:pilus assembly protein CpaC
MYDIYLSATGSASESRRPSRKHWQNQWRPLVTRAVAALLAALAAASSAEAQLQAYQPQNVVRRISDPSEKLELTTNSNRILTLDKPIPRVQVNNPELLAVTPLSATQVQISAKKAGVTQVNLWDEEGNIHSIDVMIYGDARELEVALQTQFPHSSIKVYRYSESLVLTGFVDRPDYVGPIMRLAEDYAPKVINNISVGGVQQILLKVRVMEVNRTKLRQLGVDWGQFSNGVGVVSSVSGLIAQVEQVGRGAGTSTPDIDGTGVINNLGTFQFGIVDGGNQFFGFVDFLQKRDIAKTLAEPNLVAVSGRPAQFNVGGEVPILIPQSLGTTSIEFKPFGTQIDFLPIVLGNGNIRLEVRPRISDLDDAAGIDLNDVRVPGFRVRQVDTAVELKAGQTFALAGLVQERSFTTNTGVPYLSDLPIIGVPFRSTRSDIEEIEMLVMVTPEFVDPLDPCQAPCGGPGIGTTSPNNGDLYCGGHVEVPAYCNPISGPLACGEDCNCRNGGQCSQCGQNPFPAGGVNLPGGTGYDSATYGGATGNISDQPAGAPLQLPSGAAAPPNMPVDLPLPSGNESAAGASRSDSAAFTRTSPAIARRVSSPVPMGAAAPATTTPRPYSPTRQPVYLRNAPIPNNPQGESSRAGAAAGQPGLIGPIGYDSE